MIAPSSIIPKKILDSPTPPFKNKLPETMYLHMYFDVARYGSTYEISDLIIIISLLSFLNSQEVYQCPIPTQNCGKNLYIFIKNLLLLNRYAFSSHHLLVTSS
jgi:hypothetical protein